jgi:hypothetical protein
MTLLDNHEEHDRLVEWLLLNGGRAWAKYFKSQNRSILKLPNQSSRRAWTA